MSEVKHTPGPWHVVNDPCQGLEVRAEGVTDAIKKYREESGQATAWNYLNLVARCPQVINGSGPTHGPRYLTDDDQIEANARLIAAAPDLLEACLVAVTLTVRRDWTEKHQEAFQLLADRFGNGSNDIDIDDTVLRLLKTAILKATKGA